MQLKRIGPWLLLAIIIGSVFGLKYWRQQSVSNAPPLPQVKGPAVILFRGDNSPSCQAIHRLVDDAAVQRDKQRGKQIHFAQLDWSDDNPLIKKYQIRFLPTVVFVDQQDKEVARIVGESPAVQQKLKQTLTHIDELLLQ
ncbi:MAG: thioredoxin family protein [Gammaproteobacteria bacterium]|jgi:thioredoxin 1